MPFVIRLQSCNLEADPEERADPVTGAVLPFSVERGMTALEKVAVRERLVTGGAVGPDAFDRYRVYFPGGRMAEATFPHLLGDARCTHGTLVAPEVFEQLVALAFDLAKVGNLLLMPDGVPRPLVPTEAQRLRMFRRWPNVITVPTVSRLWAMLGPPPPPAEEPEVKEPTAEADGAAGDTPAEAAGEPAAAGEAHRPAG